MAPEVAEPGQRPHRSDPERYQKEYPDPVGDQPASALTEEGPKRDQRAAGKDEKRSFHQVKSTKEHGDTAESNEQT